MGANLQYEGIKDVINQIGLKDESAKEPELSPAQIRNEWTRLASVMNKTNQKSFKSAKT